MDVSERQVQRYIERLLAEDDDERNAAAFDEASAKATLDWEHKETVSEVDRGAYYDTWVERVPVTGGPINIRRIADTFAQRAGQDGASYGTFGGYTTRRVKAVDGDAILVEATYHIGD